MKLADKIAYRLAMEYQKNGYEIVIPNFYMGKYEMDLFRRLKSGYIYEYEIKISRSDYFNDFKKYHSVARGSFPNRTYDRILKHDQIQKGLGQQNRFYFVVPKGLIQLNEVPDYAGLIEFYHNRVDRFSIVKQAPLLHKKKSDDLKFFKDLSISLSFREMQQRYKNVRMKKVIDELKHQSKANKPTLSKAF